MSPRLVFGLVALAAALGLAGIWPRAANVKPGPRTWRAVRVWHSLAQDRDLDVFDQPASAAPRGLADDAAGVLTAAPCALVAAGDLRRGVTPFGDPRRLGGALSLATLAALALGCGLVARTLADRGPLTALGATAASVLALPVAGRLAAEPDPALALSFLGAALMFAWRGDPRVSTGARLLVAAAVVALEPAGALCALVVLADLRRDDPDAELNPLVALAVAALVAAPMWGLARLRGPDAGWAIGDAAGVLAPAVAAGLAALAERGRLAVALGGALAVAASLSAGVAARAGVAAGPGPALAWLAREGAPAVRQALLPSDVFESWNGLAADVGAPWWAALALACAAAVGGVTVRRVPGWLALGTLAGSGALALGGLYLGTLAPQELHRTSFAGAPAVVDTAAPVARWFPPQGTWAARADLELVQRGWGAVLPGEPLARLVVRDAAGRELELPLAGAADGARRVRFALPWRTDVREVRLERRHAVAQLAVRGLWLGDVRARLAGGLGR